MIKIWIPHKQRTFLEKLYCSRLNDSGVSGKGMGQTFPGMQLPTEGTEVEQRDMRCAKAIMADGQLCYFSHVSCV